MKGVPPSSPPTDTLVTYTTLFRARADQQTALRDLAAEALELLRVAQELDDLLQLLLGLVYAGDVVEGYATDLLGQQARLRLAEAPGLAAAALHLAHEEDPHADQQQHGQPGDQQTGEAGVVLDRVNGEVNDATTK